MGTPCTIPPLKKKLNNKKKSQIHLNKNFCVSSGWSSILFSPTSPIQDPLSSEHRVVVVRGAAPRSSLRAGAAAGRPAARRRLRAAGLGRAGAGGGGAVPGTYLLAAAAALGWYRPGSALIGGGGRGALCKCRHRPPQRTARSTAATVSAAARGIAATRVLPRVGVIGGGCRGAPWIGSTRVP